ncbi:MAG: DMT family transporter [Fervidobacterium sp.]
MKYLDLLWLVIVWGSYYVSNKIALKTFSVSFTGVFIRVFVLFTMIFYMYHKRELKSLFNVSYILPRLVLIGLFGFLLDFTAFMGFRYSSASKGAVLLRSDVIFSTIIGAFLGESVGVLEVIVILLMILGVFLVSGQQIENFTFQLGDLFFLLSALFISLNAFVIRSVQSDRRNPGSDNLIAFYNNFFTLGFFLLFSGGSLRKTVYSNSSFTSTTVKNMGIYISLLGLILSSIFQFLIYVFYYSSLRKYPVWLVRSILLLMPVYVSIISFIFLHEKLTLLQLLGMVIILICAFFLTQRLYRTKKNYE